MRQRGSEYLSMRGTRADALAWGRSQPAGHYWIFDGSELIRLTEDASQLESEVPASDPAPEHPLTSVVHQGCCASLRDGLGHP